MRFEPVLIFLFFCTMLSSGCTSQSGLPASSQDGSGAGFSHPVFETHELNSTFTVGGVEFRVSDYRVGERYGGPFVGDNTDEKFVMFDLEAVNRRDSPVYFKEEYFKLQNSSGGNHTAKGNLAIDQFLKERVTGEGLKPGQSQSGSLLFELQQGTGAYLVIEPPYKSKGGNTQIAGEPHAVSLSAESGSIEVRQLKFEDSGSETSAD